MSLHLSAPLVSLYWLYSLVGSLLVAGVMASGDHKPMSPWLMYKGRHAHPLAQNQTVISQKDFDWLYWVTGSLRPDTECQGMME